MLATNAGELQEAAAIECQRFDFLLGTIDQFLEEAGQPRRVARLEPAALRVPPARV